MVPTILDTSPNTTSDPLEMVVAPEILRWVRDGVSISLDEWNRRFPFYEEWMSGDVKPVWSDLSELSRELGIAFPIFLMEQPPSDMDVPDNREKQRVFSHNLNNILALCLQRQDWFARERPSPHAGTLTLRTSPAAAAAAISVEIGWPSETTPREMECEDLIDDLSEHAEASDVLVMISDTVDIRASQLNRFNPEEFRGFALADRAASLVFVNGAAPTQDQTVALASGLAHVWLGETAIYDLTDESNAVYRQEQWCNTVAAHLLGQITMSDRNNSTVNVSASDPKPDTDAYYETLLKKASRRFVKSLIPSALGGEVLLTDAADMLGNVKVKTVHGLQEYFDAEMN